MCGYFMMTPNNTNTIQGTIVEHLFCNSLPHHPNAFNKIKRALDIKMDAIISDSEVIGGNHRKGDIIIRFNNTEKIIRASVKSFGGAGYNHIERRRLNDFCRYNQIPKADEEFLKKLIDAKAMATHRHTPLVGTAKDKATVKRIFSHIEVGVSALVGNDHPQIMALYYKDESRWKIYDMARQVIPLVTVANGIGFTVLSSNIQIGDYIVLQRKGSQRGDGERANDIQIKMKVRRFYKDVEPLCTYQL